MVAVTVARPQRPYDAVAASLSAAGSREERMRAVVDALWEGLREKGVSWVGFYLDRPGEPDDRRLELGPYRDEPACTPIGLHGVCGQAFRFRLTRIVPDVSELGEDYIACDPRDRSEITVPLVDESGACWGVLDLDSRDVAAFDEADEQGLYRVLKAAGLL
jgi:putative methionine-R-sulfoxide reductase with GAF domain